MTKRSASSITNHDPSLYRVMKVYERDLYLLLVAVGYYMPGSVHEAEYVRLRSELQQALDSFKSDGAAVRATGI